MSITCFPDPVEKKIQTASKSLTTFLPHSGLYHLEILTHFSGWAIVYLTVIPLLSSWYIFTVLVILCWSVFFFIFPWRAIFWPSPKAPCLLHKQENLPFPKGAPKLYPNRTLVAAWCCSSCRFWTMNDDFVSHPSISRGACISGMMSTLKQKFAGHSTYTLPPCWLQRVCLTLTSTGPRSGQLLPSLWVTPLCCQNP